ncbi:hypothetical protein Moror_6256 [Moniliophthora roreri MCA 2997]|uniref:Uncharacterized protein n=2 Tax=Moniliophthora roreri TaxID=221103 RepID=V2XDD0_MONRO|nr:hypothetical protein Moror_6256 [Moniliophthora roreri MCA 2997]KAI3618942.1 hypothetical protein WG66_000597 [Moniliophthora roreri]
MPLLRTSLAVAVALLSGFARALPPSSSVGGLSKPSSTTSSAAVTGSQIRAVQDPVFHFYLQNSDGKAVLGPESSSGHFDIDGTISISDSSPSLYLNADSSSSKSYQALTFNETATTSSWGLEGDTIIITDPRQLNFLACATNSSEIYDVYLQMGNDIPSGQSCTMITLHLPCLC